jgi:hypothetical protein
VSLIFYCVLNSKDEILIIPTWDMYYWYCSTLTLIGSYTDSYCSVYDLCGGIIHNKISLLSIYDIDDDISEPLYEDNLYACNMING